MQLAQARSDFDRLKVRDDARAVEAAAAILERKEIQTEASVLVAQAERAIAKANPPKTPGRTPKTEAEKNGPPGGTISKQERSKLRAAHSRITDEQFDSVVEQARAAGQPVSRKALADLSKAARKAERAAKVEEKRDEARAKAPTGRQAVRRCSLERYETEPGLDAIFTDPPCRAEDLGLWAELARLAADTLRPGGLLLAVSGQMFLPAVITGLSSSRLLTYRWQGALVSQKPREKMHAAKVSTGWKPLIAYTRVGAHPDFYPEDCFHAGPYKAETQGEHEWGQDLPLMLAVAKEWLRPGWRVCDPFCGAGSLLVAAKTIGCKVEGCDTVQKHVDDTRRKLAEIVVG